MRILKRIKWGIVKRIRLFFNPYDKIFSNPDTKCHFVGIGGIGMSAMAHIMKDRGHEITGSDIKETNIIEKLRTAGIRVNIKHNKENIDKDTDVVVVSSAIPKNNPEIDRALELGIPIVKRSFVLGQIMKQYKGIAISGTHGKTTTTTMISLILDKAGMSPTAMIGGEVKNIGGNYLIGKGEYMVAEACEYDRSFLDLEPHIAIITNIEPDHLDYYRDMGEIKTAFLRFVGKLPNDGLLIISADDQDVIDVAKAARCKVVGYGFGSKNRMMEGVIDEYWEVEDVNQGGGETNFVISNGDIKEKFTLKIPGKHNISNACAAIILSSHLKVDMNTVCDFFGSFAGTNRRFQILGEKNDIIVIDDYAHHPTEVKSTLEGVKNFYDNRKLYVVFEAHQHSRTKLLLEEFGKSFSNSDFVIIPDICAVRDTDADIKSIHAKDLVEEINKNGSEAIYIPKYDEIVKYLKENVEPGSIIMTMGAGYAYKVGLDYLEK